MRTPDDLNARGVLAQVEGMLTTLDAQLEDDDLDDAQIHEHLEQIRTGIDQALHRAT